MSVLLIPHQTPSLLLPGGPQRQRDATRMHRLHTNPINALAKDPFSPPSAVHFLPLTFQQPPRQRLIPSRESSTILLY
jgi:hypothetical protein